MGGPRQGPTGASALAEAILSPLMAPCTAEIILNTKGVGLIVRLVGTQKSAPRQHSCSFHQQSLFRIMQML